MKKPSLDDAAHPIRQKAIRLIEHAIEPVMRPQRGIRGEQYYELEDAIVRVLAADNNTIT
jgi:hypothetical protein